jgi:hypothetical protein
VDEVDAHDVTAPGRSWRSTAVGLAQMLIVPQGFTLAVGGSLAICLGRHGFPGPLGVWLFVVGAALGYWVVLLVVRAVREPEHQPVAIVGAGLLNVTAVVVVPIVTAVHWWISDVNIAFLSAGLAVHLAYIPLAATGLRLLGRVTASAPGSRGRGAA